MKPRLTSNVFGHLPNGSPVQAWNLAGRGGLEVEVLTYGGIVRRALAPRAQGQNIDVVLGFSDLAPYLTNTPYLGVILGRVAGRITRAQFDLDGNTWKLAANDPPNHLHGGIEGFGKKLWNASPVTRSDSTPSLRLTRLSPDGEEGYPGNVKIAVTYTVTDDNILIIDTTAVTDKPTPLSMANHSYFNLSGKGSGSIDDHMLTIHSDGFVPCDEHRTLLGRVESVDGQGADFRRERRLGEAIPLLFQNCGDLYPLGRAGDADQSSLLHAARLRCEASIMDVFTTATHVQLYTAAYLDGSLTGKAGVAYKQYAGVCLECHGYPDGPNVPDCGDIILQPGQVQQHTTAYAFSMAQ